VTRSNALEQVACNLCGGHDIRVLHLASYQYETHAAADLTDRFKSSSGEQLTYQLVVCQQCGLQYVSPRLRGEVVLKSYEGGADEQFVSQARGRELTFGKCLNLIERAWRRPPGRLLDIGTAGGSFPYIASKRGWRVDACEPNRWLCEWGRQNYGMPIASGTVFDQKYESSSYDLVTLWDVLEHTADPKAEIGETHRLLKDSGLLVVNYPDIGSWIARLMGRSWVFLLDVHLYYFTRATIARLLDKSGFEVLFVRPHYQRLSLGYVLRRASAYVGAPARMVARIAAIAGLSEIQVPYWMGQTLVIARKRLRTAENVPTA
jgi:2-polyprenyl-3-methyl-5-hydroxy-6-metoxy-1,4-benzoquinol methylase